MSPFWNAYRVARRSILYQRYVSLPVAIEKIRLRNYKHARRHVYDGHVAASDRIAVCVHWNPAGTTDESYLRLLDALARRGVAVLLISNSGLPDGYIDSLRGRTWKIIERDNVGADFGAWKDGIDFLRSNDVRVERLIFFNDSVYYREQGLNDFVAALADPSFDATAAFENWAEGYHIQSFALAVSGDVYKSAAFRSFWENYMPIANRIHAIENGEKLLSQAILKSARTTRILYSAARLYEKIKEAKGIHFLMIKVPVQWRGILMRSLGEKPDHDWFANKIIDVINSTSPIHSGAFFYPCYLDCPMFKYDLVFRQRFEYWEVERWTTEVMSAEERGQYLDRMRKKGHGNMLRGAERRKYDVGVR